MVFSSSLRVPSMQRSFLTIPFTSTASAFSIEKPASHDLVESVENTAMGNSVRAPRRSVGNVVSDKSSNSSTQDGHLTT